MTPPFPPPSSSRPSSSSGASRSPFAGSGGAHRGPSPFGFPAGAPGGRGAAKDTRREITDALIALLVTALFGGLALGALWGLFSPRVRVVSDGEGVYLVNSESEEVIAGDGSFLLMGLAVGAVLGLLIFLLRRRGGVGAVLGLALGSAIGAVIAWRLGILLGPEQDLVARAAEFGEGEPFDAPLELRTLGSLIGLPFGALLAHFVGTALWSPRENEIPPPPFPRWN
ncbi:ABC transporter permease [Streptomyces sp. ST2-7A]|uniref:ABC transporter permease n=1 Tax=Streptomyces sp. ST2-7A TaxID=2907214 RepID=UPI001F3847EB|nr:ABC transporter permease [Streptomyces sp. ST2-7A]MCE7082007.1 ABC transporter permease [Streptomyces sp. ST2-7A]